MLRPKVGANLLDTINDAGLQDLSIFGLCDKQLACLSCRVNFKHGYETLPPVSVDEDDAMDQLNDLYRPK